MVIPHQASNTLERTKSAAKRAYASPVQEVNWVQVESYLPLLKSIVARMRIYFPTQIDSHDVYSVGLSGLISAVKQFDASKGRSFGGYAKLRIRGALLDELRRMDWLSRDDRDTVKKYRKSVATLEQELGRAPTQEEICNLLKISVKEQDKLQDLNRPMIQVPLDAPLHAVDDNAPSLHEILSDPTGQNGRDVTERNEVISCVRECLEELEEMQKKVLGFYYLEGLRLAEIATLFQLSESRICQIHAKALSQVRVLLQEKLKR